MHFFTDQTIMVTCVLGLTALACYTDLQSHRIPNRLTGAMILLGLSLQTSTYGWAGTLNALGGFSLCGVVFLIFYLAGGMGAGDVKLIAAEGCLLGAHRSFVLLLGTVIAGGLFAAMLAAKKRCLGQTFRNVASLVRYHSQTGLRPHPELNLSNKGALRLPYALAVAAGVMVALFVHPAMRCLQ